MYDFAYHKPATVADAVKLLADPDAKAISGGHTLIPALKHRLNRPSAIVDLSGIAEMKGIRKEGNAIVIGALTCHAEVANSAEVKAAIPALAYLASHIGDVQVRNRGTLGGSVSNNDPAADYPAAVLGLGATIHTSKRKIAADDFFQGMFTTALEPGEIITAVSFPIPEKAAYAKFQQPASRFALTGAFVAKYPSGVRVAITGASEGGVFRWRAAEAALSASFSAAALAGVEAPAEGMIGDLHGTPAYRAHLCGVMTRRAVAAAI